MNYKIKFVNSPSVVDVSDGIVIAAQLTVPCVLESGEEKDFGVILNVDRALTRASMEPAMRRMAKTFLKEWETQTGLSSDFLSDVPDAVAAIVEAHNG